MGDSLAGGDRFEARSSLGTNALLVCTRSQVLNSSRARAYARFHGVGRDGVRTPIAAARRLRPDG
jgi:hypothetical protein